MKIVVRKNAPKMDFFQFFWARDGVFLIFFRFFLFKTAFFDP